MGDFFERMADVFGLQNEPVAFPYHVDRRDKAEKFSCVEGSSVEVEYLLLAQSLIRVAKPQAVLETGTYLGYSTLALADAVKANGFGKVVTIDISSEFLKTAQENFDKFDPSLLDVTEFHHGSSLEIIPQLQGMFGFCLFDSGSNSSQLPLRVQEFEAMRRHGLLAKESYSFFHDTSPYHGRLKPFNKMVSDLSAKYNGNPIFFDLSRGCAVVKFCKPDRI